MTTLLLFSSPATSADDANVAAFAAFLGCPVQQVGSEAELSQFLASEGENAQFAGIVVHADNLGFLLNRRSGLLTGEVHIPIRGNIFVYGFSPNVPEIFLKTLTRGRVSGVQRAPQCAKGHLPLESRPFSHQLAGSTFPRSRKATTSDCCVFSGISDEQDLVPLVTLAGNPSALYLSLGNDNLFLSSTNRLPSPEQQVQEEESIEAFYDSLLPLLMFIRHVAGESSWHGGSKAARLIIDDPVLRLRYGYLDFQKLFNSMAKYKYSATVAYIPWNYKRTTREQAAFFKSQSKQFTICVHGCDHINNEYVSNDEDLLLHKSALALKRMNLHEAGTAIPWEPVIVFPQGRFSSQSLRALRVTNYLGAINTTRFPLNSATPISVGDLLLPAIAGLEGFPVFPRHYPAEDFALLFDLFLGRPAFVVEHHEYFKSGLPELEKLVERMNSCQPGLKWGSITDTLTNACWKRSQRHDQCEVRFFTDTFEVTNTSQVRCSYIIWKQEPEKSAKGKVLVEGNELVMEYAADRLQAEFVLSPQQRALAQIFPTKSRTGARQNEGIKYTAKVFLRRALSEFRDEVLVRNPVLLAPAKALVKLMKADSGPQKSRLSPPSPG